MNNIFDPNVLPYFDAAAGVIHNESPAPLGPSEAL